jgi:hypothetical protein
LGLTMSNGDVALQLFALQ